MLPSVEVTHSGLYSDGRPNTAPILISDVSYVGGEQQNRKAPVYVPPGGSIVLPLSSEVAFSFEKGSIFQLTAAGLVSSALLGVLPEAPSDGATYGRRDESWVPVSVPEGQEWRISGTGTGTVDILSLPYGANEGPDEFDVRVLLVLVGDVQRSGVMELLGKASRGTGNIDVRSVRRRADNLAQNQNIVLATTGGSNAVVRLILGSNPIEYRAIIRRRTWSDFA